MDQMTLFSLASELPAELPADEPLGRGWRRCAVPSCRRPFRPNVGEAGYKFCSTACQRVGYRRGQRVWADGPPPRIMCAWCGTEAPPHTNIDPRRSWPYVCKPCRAPLRFVMERLLRHHVGHERARKLLVDPTCEVPSCEVNIIVRVARNHSRPRARLVVDHDHQCCPGGHYSCGRCVLGLICDDCNAARGLLRNDPGLMEGLALYQRRVSRL